MTFVLYSGVSLLDDGPLQVSLGLNRQINASNGLSSLLQSLL